MRKGLLSLLAIIFAFTTVHAATLLHEPFSQSTGSLASYSLSSSTTGKWIYTNSGFLSNNKPTAINVESGNLTWSGYATSGKGNRLSLGTNSNKTLSTWYNFSSQDKGSVFIAAIVNINQLRSYDANIDPIAPANGGYLFSLGNGTNSSQHCARLYTKTVMKNDSPIGFQFGISKLNEAVSAIAYDETVYSPNTNYLVVVEYQFQTASNDDDIVNLYINPSPVQPDEPTVTTIASSKVDIDKISLVTLIEGKAQQTKVYIDELKITTDWESLFEADAAASIPQIKVNPSTVAFTEGFMEVGQTYPVTINVQGANLEAETITLECDRPDEITFSRTTLTKSEVQNGSGVDITITAKPNKIALEEITRVTLTCGDVKKVLKIGWNANKLLECPTIASLKDAYVQGNGKQMLKVKFTGEALVTHSFLYGRSPMLYTMTVLQDATGACVIRRDSVYFNRDSTDVNNIIITDLMAVGNKVTGMQLTDGATCLLTNDSIAQPDFKVNSTGNPLVPAVISASEMGNHLFELVTIKGTTLQPDEGKTTFDATVVQLLKNDSHGWGKCVKVNASASESSFVTSITASKDNTDTYICDLINQPIPTQKLNATGLVWGDAELRLRNKSDLAEIVMATVTLSCNPAQGSVTGGGEVEAGTSVTISATPAAHYHFVKWSDGVTTNPRDIQVTSNVTLTAEFAIDQHTVTASGTNGTVTGTGTFDYGKTTKLTATPAAHYHFVKWSDGVTTNPRDVEVTGNVTLTAEFAIDQHTVTASGTNGTVTGAGTFNYGATATLTATPAAHYHFVKWSDGVETATRDIQVTGNITLTAEFAIDQHTVKASGENGTVTGAGTFNYGETITLKATPDDHFRFVKWSDGVTTETRQITVNGNVEFIALFEAIEFTVTVSCDPEQGTVTGGGTFQEGSTATISATPKAHFRFVRWSDGVETAERTVTVTEDTTFTAEFEAIIFTVTVEWDAAMGSVSGAGTFQEGTDIELTANAVQGFSFFQWSDGNTDNPRTITVERDLFLTAIFVQDKPTTLDQTTSEVSVKKVMRDGHILIIRNDDAYDLTGRKQ